MPRSSDRDRGSKRSAKDTGRRTKKKICIFCKDKIDWVDYKDVNLLRKFMSDRGKIRARRVSGNCAQHQRDVAVAIKTARELALLPYSQRTMTERSGGRGGRGSPRPVVPRAEPQVGATAGPGGRPDGAGRALVPSEPPASAAPSEPERPAAPVGADAGGGGDQ
jgi:small subunit ribosomal protein S18